MRRYQKTGISLEIRGFVSNFTLKMRSSTPDFTGKCGIALPIFMVLPDILNQHNSIKNDRIMEKKEKQPLSVGMKLCRVIGVVLVCAAIGYLIWSGDFDHKGIVGYVDDFMLFMAAYTFARGSFLRPERRYIRRQLYMLSSLFALLALCWVIMLAFIK